MALGGRSTSFGLRGKENDDFCLTDVVEVFNSPINEDQAWAVCYQCTQCFIRGISDKEYVDLCRDGGRAVRICRDGTVALDSSGSGKGPPHKPTLEDGDKRKTCRSNQKALEALGKAIFQALDYGFSGQVERHLSQSLESLIELMTTPDEDDKGDNRECHSVDDEGIENDTEDEEDRVATASELSRQQQLIKMCEDRLFSNQNAGQHYKAVCRALVAEVVELLSFLDKFSGVEVKTLAKAIRAHSTDEITLDELKRADWARLWVQTMRELRLGVKLKKVEHIHLPPLEYELTPYEVLMEDIRSRRYILNKIMVNGDIPRKVKNDAHEVILNFIRSRPPLQPARDRILSAAPPKTLNEREKLLNAIRGQPKLKPLTDEKPKRSAESSRTRLFEDSDSDDTDAPVVRVRTVIKPDFSLLLNNSFELDEEDEDRDTHNETTTDEEEWEPEKTRICPTPMSPLSPLSPITPIATPKPTSTVTWRETAVDDIIANRSEKKLARRHSITVCESPNKKKWQNPVECLSLRLDEVMHIREVLTKAELESLSTQPVLYNQIAKAKLCFTCKTTRFTLFGQWGTKCRLCKRTVCNKCLRKMHVPTDHFEKIPVYTLSPTPLTPEGQDVLKKLAGTGSKPPSPVVTGTPDLKPSQISSGRRRPLMRSHTITSRPPEAEMLRGPQMNVCCECKKMVCEIIRVSRTSVVLATHGNDWQPQKTRASRNFHLDLKPV